MNVTTPIIDLRGKRGLVISVANDCGIAAGSDLLDQCPISAATPGVFRLSRVTPPSSVWRRRLWV